MKNLLYYYQLFGCLENCLIIRKIYRIKLINIQKEDILINLDALRACLEVNRPDLVLYFYKNKKCKYFDRKKAFEIFQFANLLKKKNIYEINKNNYFNKLISNKNIFLKGPIKYNLKKNLYNNEEFVHISMNAMGEKRNYNSISYYNGTCASIFSNKIINVYPYLLFTCFKTKEGLMLILNKFYEKKKSRIFFNANNILLNKYGANHTQNIIYDLLLNNPKKILLTGINFYLGKKAYYKNYKSNIFTEKNLAHSMRVHDPFSNFFFLQNLLKRRLIYTDKKTQRILNLKDKIFAKKLNKQYRQFIL